MFLLFLSILLLGLDYTYVYLRVHTPAGGGLVLMSIVHVVQ